MEDKNDKFKNALEKFNKNRSKYAIEQIATEVEDSTMENKDSNAESIVEEPDDIVFLRNAIEVLKEKYDIDSQGIFEYMKEIVDIKLGSEVREKVWKKLDETRYTRCLLLDIEDKKYMVDVDEKGIRLLDEEELTLLDSKEHSDFTRFKHFSRSWDDYYDGK